MMSWNVSGRCRDFLLSQVSDRAMTESVGEYARGRVQKEAQGLVRQCRIG